MKHAFLIMLHSNYEQTKKLLKLLDNVENHFFIHVDKKSNFSKKEEVDFRECIIKGQITFVERISVHWGGDSQIRAELALLKEAVKEDFDYFHLISGVDLPVKDWKTIDAYFQDNNGYQFVSFSPERYQVSLQKRVKYYWLFQEKIGNPKVAIKRRQMVKIFLLALQRGLIEIQQLFHVDRRKNQKIEFRTGSNWFSVTGDFARYIVQQERWIKKTFKYTLCGDEVFVCTLLANSKFAKQVLPNQRYVDWKRGNPYVFRLEDLNELLTCNKIFARKFDQTIDNKIIDAIYDKVKG